MQKPLKYIIFLILLLLPISKISAQGVRLFTSAEGLPSSQFISMAQDKEGYIWICNFNGLARFDGTGLTSFYESRGKNNLRSKNVYKWIVDRLGQNWVATDRGIELYHPETESFEHVVLDRREDDNEINTGKSMQAVDMVILPDRSTLFVCIEDGSYYAVDIHSHKVLQKKTMRFMSILKNVKAKHIFVDSRLRLWLGENTITLVNLKTYNKINLSFSVKSGISSNGIDISGFLEEKNTHIVLISDKWNGVLFWDEKGKQLSKLTHDSNKYQNAQCLLQKKDGTLLLGCENNGIGQINLNKREITDYKIDNCPINLKNSKVHSLMEDKWGNLYAGIYQKGLLIVPASSSGFKYLTVGDSPESKNMETVTSFVRAGDGRILVGTDGSGVFCGNTMNNLKHLSSPPLCNNAIMTMEVGEKGDVWIATYGSGLFYYNKGKIKAINNVRNSMVKNIFSLQLDKKHNKLYIGTIGYGLVCLDLISGMLKKIPINISWVYSLKLDSKGRLWIGNLKCICYDTNRNKLCQLNTSAINNTTVNEFIEQNNYMYIGTSNGLYIYDEKSDYCTYYPIDNEKAVSVLSLVKEKNSDVLWMSTSMGIISFKCSNGHSHFSSSYDIQKVGDFHSNADFCDENGTLAFGGDNGILAFNPITIKNKKSHLSKIRFNILNVNGENIVYKNREKFLDKALGYASQVTLPYNQSSLVIGFTVLNYTLTSQIHYQYILQGYEDKEHTTTSISPQAVYNQLPPGEYKLIVKGYNDRNEEQTFDASIGIIIQSPWFWCVWSKMIYFSIFTFLVFTQYRIYLIRKRSKKRLRDVMSEFLRIKENYQKFIKTMLAEEDSHTESFDDKLKKKIMSSISKHLSDTDFNVEELSSEVALSRVQLYRRTKDLFNSSPNDLLRVARMKKASLMLIQGKYSVSDVAYEVGYSEPSYFSKAFKNYYNISPKEFVTRYRDNADEETLKQIFEL